MNQRRRRSQAVPTALNYFLKALCFKRNVEALTLTTTQGEFIAGAGDTDVEHLGLLGAASHRRTLRFDDRQAFVSRFDVNNTQLCLTSLGAPVADDSAIGGIMRILT
jgi:hypothetical protein